MKIKEQVERIKPTYLKPVEIPEKFIPFFWDEPGKKVILEKFIFRVLTYGDFEDIKWLYEKYPEETFYVAMRYPEIKRGVRFWIRHWKEKTLKR